MITVQAGTKYILESYYPRDSMQTLALSSSVRFKDAFFKRI